MKADSKNGGILVIVMLMVLIISTLMAGIFKLYETDSVEAVYVDNTCQAFWLAESGLQRALDKLRTDKSFRINPYGWTEVISNGSCTVEVSYSGSSVWNIISTGTVANVNRAITLDPYLYAEVGYGLMGLNGDSRLDKNGDIDGNVYVYGELWVNGRATPNVNGEILALDGRNIDPTPISGNDKIEMEILSSEWDFSVPGDAETFMTTNVVEGGVTNTYKYLDLRGKVVKKTGGYTLPNDVHGTIGDGKLIVIGDLKFPTTTGYSYTIGDGATIMVDGDMIAKKDGTFGDNVKVYVNGDMSLSKTGTGSTTTFLVEGDLTVDKDLDFSGLIFVDGSVTVDGNLNLTGSLIAGEGFTLKKDYDIEYDASYIDQSILDNMILYVVYATSPGSWNELPSL